MAEFFNKTENIIPPAAIEAGRVIPQFVQNLIHLKCGQYGFNQYGGADSPAGDSDFILCKIENVIPESRLEMRFHLRQIKIRSSFAFRQFACVIKKIEAEIKKGGRNRSAVYSH